MLHAKKLSKLANFSQSYSKNKSVTFFIERRCILNRVHASNKYRYLTADVSATLIYLLTSKNTQVYTVPREEVPVAL